MELFPLLKELTEAPGPSGEEGTVREVVQGRWEALADEVRTDAMGNLIALQRGRAPAPRPVVMAAAHMDEIALIVTGLEGEFLRVHRLGGTDRRVLLGAEVTVHGRKPLYGIIGARPPHVLPPDEREKVPPWERLFVDTGLPAETLAALVRVGDPITLRRETVALKNERAAGKAMDNRASVAALTLALEWLRDRAHAWDFYAVATVQEEVGLKGAVASAYGVAPQIAVALDVTFGKQHDDRRLGTQELDKGPAVGIGPNFHPQVVARLKAAAEQEEIPYQWEPTPGPSGTDAWAIQVSREGVPTGLLSIPLRYMHQPVETVSLRDVARTARLLVAFVAALPLHFRPGWEDEEPEAKDG